MGYQVLARKYRPQRFADVAGQDHVTRTLLNALAQNRIAHGYIFSGHRGIGKTTIARIVAQALNCRTAIGTAERPTPEPCGICDSCVEIKQGNAVDVIEIDAATNRGIDEIRELRDAARYAPARDRYKIYILDEAHQITEAAFNALLKTLEEPPSHVVFMMATTEPENIPQTIRSRCQHFSFHAVKFDDILAQLRMIAGHEQVEAEDAALALLAEAGDGSMRDALSIMDQAIASAPSDEAGRAVLSAEQIRELMGSVPNAVFERLLEAVAAGQSAELMEQLNVLLNAGHSPSSLARQMVRYLRNALMAKLGGEQTELLQISADERARAGRTALLFGEEDLTRNLQIVLRTFDDLNYRQEQRFHLELGLLKLVHAQRLLPLEELLSGVASGAMRSAAPANPARPVSSGAAAPRQASSAPVAKPASAPLSPFAPIPGFGSGPAVKLSTTVVAEEGVATRTSDGGLPPLRREEIARTGHGAEEGVATKTSDGGLPPLRREEIARTGHGAEEGVATKTSDGGLPPLRREEIARTGHGAAPGVATRTSDGGLPPLRREEIARTGHGTTPFPAVAAPMAQGFAETLTEGSLAKAPEPMPAGNASVEELRQGVTAALTNGGHGSAAQLLATGEWILDASSLRIEVPGVGKKMLGLAVNAAAEKIVRQELQRLGGPARFMVVPGEGAAASAAVMATPLSGSIEEEALKHPLVQRAKEIFEAEVRSVVDLRVK